MKKCAENVNKIIVLNQFDKVRGSNSRLCFMTIWLYLYLKGAEIHLNCVLLKINAIRATKAKIMNYLRFQKSCGVVFYGFNEFWYTTITLTRQDKRNINSYHLTWLISFFKTKISTNIFSYITLLVKLFITFTTQSSLLIPISNRAVKIFKIFWASNVLTNFLCFLHLDIDIQWERKWDIKERKDKI